MKFGDRIACSSHKVHLHKMRRYWEHLSEQGFSPGDLVYRYFAGEVFHDSEVVVRKVDLSEQVVVLQMRNVHAVDRICEYLTKRGVDHRNVDREDFLTAVTFQGATRFEYSGTEGLGLYVCAELSRQGEGIKLEMLIRPLKGFAKPSTMKIAFRKAHIESILPRLRKYTCGRRVRHLLTWVTRDPDYYAKRYRRPSR